MTCSTLVLRRARMATLPLLFAVAATSLSCGGVLDATDPTAILDSDASTAEGAQLLRRNVLRELYDAVDDAALETGLLADEFLYQPSTFEEQSGSASHDALLDRRDNVAYAARSSGFNKYAKWQELWTRYTSVALEKLAAHAPPEAREAHRGEMFAVRGYAGLRLAETYCPGFPLHKVENYQFLYGPPVSTEQALGQALAVFDSAVSLAADSARVLNFARVGRARTLLSLGRFPEAASAVADVPTSYIYQTEYSAATGPTNSLTRTASFWNSRSRSVADREGGSGLDFASAKDPRVPTDSVGPSRNGAIIMYALRKYPSEATPIVLASGREARLIEAEAALQANDHGTWLVKLNQLRQAIGLTALADPGTAPARLDLTYRERAFWLFATGTRLGDLRRLVRVYNRPAQSVFPSGVHWRGGTFSSGTSLPFDKEEVTYSPGVTGCTSW